MPEPTKLKDKLERLTALKGELSELTQTLVAKELEKNTLSREIFGSAEGDVLTEEALILGTVGLIEQFAQDANITLPPRPVTPATT